MAAIGEETLAYPTRNPEAHGFIGPAKVRQLRGALALSTDALQSALSRVCSVRDAMDFEIITALIASNSQLLGTLSQEPNVSRTNTDVVPAPTEVVAYLEWFADIEQRRVDYINEPENRDGWFCTMSNDEVQEIQTSANQLRKAATVLRELIAAAQEFVRKVDDGEARSKRSYEAFKAALAKAEGSNA